MDDQEAPRLNPTRPATEDSIREDLSIYGVAFVLNIDGTDWMIHPTQVSVYVEPEDDE